MGSCYINPMKLLLIFCNFLYYFILMAVIAFIPIYFKSIEINDTGIGFLIGIFHAASLLFIIPAGLFSDRLSPRWIIIIGIFSFSIYLIGLMTITSLILLSVFTLIGGFGSALINISILSLFYKILDEEKMGAQLGAFFCATSLGYALGPGSTGLMLTYITMRSTFAVMLFFTLLLFFATLFIKENSLSISIKLKDYLHDLWSLKVLFLIASVSAIGIHLGAEQSSLSLFMKVNLNLSYNKIGNIYFWVGIWIGLLLYIFGRLFDKDKRILLFLSIGMGISGIFQFATIYTDSYAEILLIRILHTVGDAIIFLMNGVLISIIFKEDRMGGNLGFVQAIRTNAIFLSATLGGFLNSHFGYHINFITTGILLISFALFVVTQKGRF